MSTTTENRNSKIAVKQADERRDLRFKVTGFVGSFSTRTGAVYQAARQPAKTVRDPRYGLAAKLEE